MQSAAVTVDASTLEIYDPNSNTWTSGPSAPTARSLGVGAVIDSKLYVTGGLNASGAIDGTLDVFAPDLGLRTSLPPKVTGNWMVMVLITADLGVIFLYTAESGFASGLFGQGLNLPGDNTMYTYRPADRPGIQLRWQRFHHSDLGELSDNGWRTGRDRKMYWSRKSRLDADKA